MCGACPAWDKMLSGPYAESTKSEIALPDDDSKTLHILLLIVHLTFKKLPPTLTLYELTTLAFTCDKYDTVALVRPFLSVWTAPWLEDGSFLNRGNEEWIWISYVFGYKEEFCARAKKLAKEIRVDKDGKPQVTGNKKVRVLEDLLPLGLSESLLKVRLGAITTMLNICYELIESLESTNACSHQESDNYQVCGDLMLGSLVRAWSSLDLYKSRPQATDLYQSIKYLGSVIKAIPNRTHDPFAEPNRTGSKRGHNGNIKHDFDHSYCDADIAAKLAKIRGCISNIESPVQVSHLRHVEEQAEKGRFACEHRGRILVFSSRLLSAVQKSHLKHL